MTRVIQPLPAEIQEQMVRTGVFPEGCPVSMERLALLRVAYIDFDGNEHEDGEIIVMDVVAEHVVSIFLGLKERRFPIAGIRGLHCYDACDKASMADNNTSSFNFRRVDESDSFSLHAYGLAIDINPLFNPFVCFEQPEGLARISPPGGWRYLNRGKQLPGMVESVTDLFAQHGFVVWGGNWTTPIDYHHFQLPRGLAELLALTTFTDGKRLLELALAASEFAGLPDGAALANLNALYPGDKDAFFKAFSKLLTC